MTKKEGMHTISLTVANKPGVLVRVAQVFARRAYNIDSLVVSSSVNPKYSRMTITAKGDTETLDQIIKQCAKLIDVLHSSEHTGIDSVTRECALIKAAYNAQNKKNLLSLVKKSQAQVVHDTDNTLIIEQTGTTAELDALEEQLKKYGIIEMVRSGKMVMATGKETT